MKKITMPFGIIVLIFLTIFLFFTNSLNSNAFSNKLSGNETFLKYENNKLKNSLTIFEERLKNTEEIIKKINEYDNEVYSQILGINVDSNLINENKNDIDFIFDNYNTILSKLDKRTLYASKLSSEEFNRLNAAKLLIKKNKNIMNYYPTISPIKTKDIIKISSGFGWRRHPVYHRAIFHDGVDIDAQKGVNVYATATGYVEKIKFSRIGYGNCIVIKHIYGYETLYAHLNTIILKKKGQYIEKGQIIGTVGSTGLSTGSHLHYEVSQNNHNKDPLAYFYTYITEELFANSRND